MIGRLFRRRRRARRTGVIVGMALTLALGALTTVAGAVNPEADTEANGVAGTADTTPYEVAWDSSAAAAGAHEVTARDRHTTRTTRPARWTTSGRATRR